LDKLAIAQRVFRESGRGGNVPLTSVGAQSDVARVFDAVSDAYRDIQQMQHGWRWMSREGVGTVTNVGGMRYTGAALGLLDFGRLRPHRGGGLDDAYTVRAFDPMAPATVWALRWVPEDAFARIAMDVPAAAGAPQLWSVSRAGELLVAPTPDRDYRIKLDYIVADEELSADNAVPSMPAEHHILIAWMALERIGDYDAAAEVVARARKYAEQALNALLARQGTRISVARLRL